MSQEMAFPEASSSAGSSVPRTAAPAAAPSRALSIDLLRGLDVWLMLFVNDMAHVQGTPGFLLHASGDFDGMTITDVVFPAFLFIVGLSIPFSLAARARRGDTGFAIWRHVAVRAIGLLIMGVFIVNRRSIAPDSLLSAPLWNVLMFAGLIAVWTAPPSSSIGRRRHQVVRGIGIALLLVLALLFRRQGGTGLIQLQTSWWGILGIIGWAYLVAATIYLLARGQASVLVAGIALLYAICIADGADRLPALLALRPYINVGATLAAHSAVTLSGAVLGLMFMRSRAEAWSPGRVAVGAMGIVLALAVGGWALHSLHDLHPTFWVNKIRATAAWCLLSSAWTAAAWVLLFALVEWKGWRRWPRSITTAGENALMAFLLPPLLLSLFKLAAPLFGGTNPYDTLGTSFTVGLVRAVVFSWFVIWLSGFARKRGLRMHL